jgi:TolB protein
VRKNHLWFFVTLGLLLFSCSSGGNIVQTQIPTKTVKYITYPPSTSTSVNAALTKSPPATETPIVETLPAETPASEDDILWQFSIPGKSVRSFCPADAELQESTIRGLLAFIDVIYYSVDVSLDQLPIGSEVFKRSERDDCVRFNGETPEGTYFIRYHVKIFLEPGKYVEPTYHTLAAELTKFIKIEILPPANPSAELITYRDSYQGKDGSTLTGGIMVMDPYGGGISELASTPGKGIEGYSWSLDGEYLAFVSAGNVYVTNKTGSETISLVESENWMYSPAWSPDGKTIAYVKQTTDIGLLKRVGELILINFEDKTEKKLSNAGNKVYSPSWSPDGTQIAFLSVKDDKSIYRMAGEGEILLINVINSEIIQLTDTIITFVPPVWSPDGNQIAFEKDGDIYIIDTNGQNLVNLTLSPEIFEYNPYWSPDGKQIVYSSGLEDLESGIYSITISDLEIKELHRFVKDAGGAATISWLTEDQQIVVGNSNGDISLMNSDGSGFKTVGFGISPSWKP